jgi:hypothetical protein
MGGSFSSKNRSRIQPEQRASHPPPAFDQALADRLYGSSPLINDDIRRTLADTYATIIMQIADLKARVLAGIITVDEARTMPTLINHLRKLAVDLGLTKSKEELGLMLNPLASRSFEEDDEAEA